MRTVAIQQLEEGWLVFDEEQGMRHFHTAVDAQRAVNVASKIRVDRTGRSDVVQVEWFVTDRVGRLIVEAIT